MPDRIVSYRLADGETRHAEAPRSFFIPPRAEREALRPGDYAKLLFEVTNPEPSDPGAERMWVQVLGVSDGGYVGALVNTPRAITTVGLGDRVDFGPQHVIATPGDWPLLGKKAFVSRRCQDLDLRPRYLYREDPDNERDSGWRAMVGDESDDEINNPDNVLLQDLGFLLDRWPDLKPVLQTDPQNGEWFWNDDSETYVQGAPG
ncbi:immunity protein Imm33 domain-containing protein [Flexivirga endophytica]|uniref:immunity protein Imm33 domain-containing protein n=1 Tax=Flexivirga endophytica TaxID=1849103 RepID=UPI001664B7F6|nr:DUF2185 domain-containing protein [Flexivirga endophytica]